MSEINAQLELKAQVTETFDETEMPGAVDRAVTYSDFGWKDRLNADSTPTAEMVHVAEGTGNASLDLTALARAFGGSLDATDKKLRMILVNNLSATTDLTIADGGANPYSINGTNDKVVKPGARYMEFFDDALADVSGTAKAIDITAGVAEDWELMMIFGETPP